MRSALLFLTMVACGGGDGDGGGGEDAGLYQAIFAFDGSRCGTDAVGDEAWCIQGDRCEDPERQLCAPVTSTCETDNAEEIYDAIFDFDGAVCGERDGDEAWCREGDRCVDAALAQCAIVLSPCLDMSTY